MDGIRFVNVIIGEISTLGRTLLLTLFIALKLTGMITWSWWWVLSPMWIGALVVVSVITVVGTILYIKEK